MKKIYFLLLIFSIIFAACKKNRDAELSTFLIQNEKIIPSSASVELSCEVVSSATITELYLQYGTKADFSKCEEVRMTEGKSSYSVKIDNLTANTTYYVRYLAVNSYSSMTSEKSSKFKTLIKSEPNDPDNPDNPFEPEYVDLGLSVKWATCNVGATKPEEYGDYFAWGEVEPKEIYNWSTYKYCNGSSKALTKYCSHSSYGNNGFTDGKTILDPKDDAAITNWGGAWRMPTDAELTELREKCKWTWISQNDVNGYKVVGPNGNSIFLPAAGYKDGESLLITRSFGNYWSSSLHTDYSDLAYSVYFYSDVVDKYGSNRDHGRSVRPVWGGGTDDPDNPNNPDNPDDIPTEMYMIGTDFGNWDWASAGVVSLTPVHSKPGEFWTIKYFTAANGFKFCSKKEWIGDFYSLGEDAGFTVADGNCFVPVDGLYMVYVNLVDSKLTIEPAAVYGIGDCFGGWYEKMGNAKFAVSEDGKVLIMTVPASGNLRMYAESSVATTDWWTREFNVYDGKIKFRGIGGDLDAVEVKAGQVVTINFSDNTATIIGKQYTITASSNDSSYGSVSGGGTYAEGTEVTLTATANSGYKFKEWNDGNTDNPRVITVTKDESYTAYFEKESTENAGHEFVDLGLPSGLKWATCNVGATTPEDYGYYFAWGETQPKATYDFSTYKYCKGTYKTLTKYCDISDYGNNGFTDNKTVLDPSDDAATVNWGGSWRMPTKAEQDELRNNCTWNWTTQNGVNGYKVTGPNGNSIFLPAAGYMNGSRLNLVGSHGYYWSSSLSTIYPDSAYSVFFYSNYVGRNGDFRYAGYSVRPVCM